MGGKIEDIKLTTKIILVHMLYNSVTGEEIAVSQDEEMLRNILKEMKACHTKVS